MYTVIEIDISLHVHIWGIQVEDEHTEGLLDNCAIVGKVMGG